MVFDTPYARGVPTSCHVLEVHMEQENKNFVGGSHHGGRRPGAATPRHVIPTSGTQTAGGAAELVRNAAKAFAGAVDEHEWIDRYDRAGAAARERFAGVSWPDLALEAANLERLAEGLVDGLVDAPRLAFGDDFDPEQSHDVLEEAWRTDALQARFAPEGLYVRAAFTVRLMLSEEEAGEVVADESLVIEAEFCVSFVEKFGVRPFVDFMGGAVRRIGDGIETRLDPRGFMITPEDAVAWGLNGASA